MDTGGYLFSEDEKMASPFHTEKQSEQSLFVRALTLGDSLTFAHSLAALAPKDDCSLARRCLLCKLRDLHAHPLLWSGWLLKGEIIEKSAVFVLPMSA